jgi:transglutaminase-like putative cysteine protease
MVLTGTSIVEWGAPDVAPALDVGWDVVEGEAVKDRYCEFLAASTWVPQDRDLDQVGLTIRTAALSPREAVLAATEWVRSQLDYQPGSTTVSTSAVEAWRNGCGVCQDFVHLSLAVLRAAGVPARYVSGYLHPHRDPAVGNTAIGESHAWVEAWVGDWLGIDPTNLLDIAERHVLVARGRDYGDVPPVKGIYSGGASQESTVTVELTRLA